MKYGRVIFLGIVVLVLFVLVVSNVINSPSFIAKRLNFDSKKSIEKLVFRVSYTNFIPLGEVIMENKVARGISYVYTVPRVCQHIIFAYNVV